MSRHLLTIRDLTKEEILGLIERALEIKGLGGQTSSRLRGKTLGLVFDKPSTRTRVSFEVAMFRLGGNTLFLGKADTQMSRDEPIKDTSRVLSRYLDALAVRTFAQSTVEEMARWCSIPVINALTDQYHPCQVLSDLMTVVEKKKELNGLKIAWIGDGNNVARSWINAAGILGFRLVLACPPGYHPGTDMVEWAGESVQVVEDPREAARGAHVINTDVWASMGQEAEKDQRLKVFTPYQVDQALVDLADPDVIVMHCLPAHRGEEIAEDVLEGPNSVVFDQAENKMHLHQALLEFLVAGPGK